MHHAVVAFIAAVSLIVSPIASVGDSSAPSPSPSASASPAPTSEPVEPPPPAEPAPPAEPVTPADPGANVAPESAPEASPDPEIPPPPPESPPPVDLGEQVEEAIIEQATQDVVPGPFEPKPVPFTAPAAVAPQTVQCYGDSLLGGVCSSGSPSPLSAVLPGWTTLAYSQGGQWSTSIAVNAGAYRMQLTQPVTIAAADATNLPEPFMFEVPARSMGGLSMRASIADVVGTLVHRPDLGIIWRFVRDNPGDPVTVAPGTPIVSLQAMAPGAASIIWVGTNNLTATDQIVADVDAMVALHKSVSDQPFWVVSITPAWGNCRIHLRHRALSGEQGARSALRRPLCAARRIHRKRCADRLRHPADVSRPGLDRLRAQSSSFHSSADWIHFNRTGCDAIARFLARFVKDGTTAAQQRTLFNAEAALSVDVYGATIVVRGWAFDRSDLYQRIPVGITIDDQWMLGTYADGPSPELSQYGVPGGHGFSWSTKLRDGATYKVCIVGVGFGAGANAYPPCVSVTIPSCFHKVISPSSTWAVGRWPSSAGDFDHADLYAHIPVGIMIDGRWHVGITAALESPYLRPYGVPGDHAFFAGAQVGRGTHSVCAVGVSRATGRNAMLDCDSIVLG